MDGKTIHANLPIRTFKRLAVEIGKWAHAPGGLGFLQKEDNATAGKGVG